MSKQARDENAVPVERVFTPGITQTAAATSVSGSIANAITAGVDVVRLVATGPCFVKVAASPTAATSDMYMPAGVPELIHVKHDGTDKVAAIRSGGSDATLYVTEMM